MASGTLRISCWMAACRRTASRSPARTADWAWKSARERTLACRRSSGESSTLRELIASPSGSRRERHLIARAELGEPSADGADDFVGVVPEVFRVVELDRVLLVIALVDIVELD